jgi:predicted nucleic acid-binding Zn ribbon protein
MRFLKKLVSNVRKLINVIFFICGILWPIVLGYLVLDLLKADLIERLIICLGLWTWFNDRLPLDTDDDSIEADYEPSLKETIEYKNCEQCNKSFDPSSSKSGDEDIEKQYCSIECSNRAFKICYWCKEGPFDYFGWKSDYENLEKYCSTECFDKAKKRAMQFDNWIALIFYGLIALIIIVVVSAILSISK